MKNTIQYIAVSLVISLAFSCGNDFLTDEPTFISEGSPIVISPEWETQDYEIYCEDVGNAEFTVAHAPSWLTISSPSGQFINHVATLNCKANVYKDFSKIGMYHALITLSVEGKGNVAIPVLYIVEGNPVIEIANSVTISYDNPNGSSLLIKNAGNGILMWSVIQRPEWLLMYGEMYESSVIEDYSVYVSPSNGQSFIYLSLDPTVSFSENLSGKILIQTNDKNKPIVEVEVEIDVEMNLGNPSLYIWDEYSTIDFGRTETSLYFNFSNQGSGILTWQIEGCPEWLTVSEYNGALYMYNGVNLTFSCNREIMPDGINTTTIYLKTNDKTRPSFPITVIARSNTANPDNVKPIDGNITDAYFDKQTNVLYLTTAQPNRFIAYDLHTKSILQEISLAKAPTCFTVSEDRHKAAIGHSGLISAINMENFTLTKTIEISYLVYDIAWTDDDWYCYTQKGGNFTNLHSINIETEAGQDYNEGGYGSSYTDGATNVGKVPGQPYIIAARRETSPTGIIVYDINTRSNKNYMHESIGNFWFPPDGKYLFESNMGSVFKTADIMTFSDIVGFAPIDKLKLDSNQYSYYNINWIDFSKENLWVLYNSTIYQLDTSDYVIMKTYYYDDTYNGHPVQAHYVFANQSETELVVIRNATNGTAMWSLEFIPVTK